MPEFGRAFSGLANDRGLTRGELLRVIKGSIAAEYEAVQSYMRLAEALNDELASKVLRKIADEERSHAGDYLRLLTQLDPEEANLCKEVVELMERSKAFRASCVEVAD